jgi:hypothetical protein
VWLPRAGCLGGGAAPLDQFGPRQRFPPKQMRRRKALELSWSNTQSQPVDAGGLAGSIELGIVDGRPFALDLGELCQHESTSRGRHETPPDYRVISDATDNTGELIASRLTAECILRRI